MEKLLKTENIFLAIFFSLVTASMFMLDPAELAYKVITIIILTIAIVYTFIKKDKISFNHPVVITVTLFFTAMSFASIIASGGKFAIYEYVKIVIGYSTFLVVIASGKKSILPIFWLIATYGAFNAFFSIEGSSFAKVQPFFEKLIYGQAQTTHAWFHSSRISSILGNANVFVTLIGVSLFTTLYIFTNTKSTYVKYLQAFYLVTLTNAFFLAFSMGGTFSFVMSVIVFLFISPKEKIFSNLFTVLLSAIIGLISVLLTINTYIENGSSGSILPIISVFIGTIIFIVVDSFVSKKVSVFEEKHKKAGLITLVLTLILGVVFAGLAYTTTSSYSLEKGQSFSRTVYPTAGDYQLELTLSDPNDSVDIRLISRTAEQNLENSTSSLLPLVTVKNGDKISLEVSEDLILVTLIVVNSSENDIKIENISLTSSENSVNVPLNYVFLPENIASRLQGLKTNYSVTTRATYQDDAIKLYKQNPIFGNGLGAFEDKIQSVQDYYYETKYAHNHFMQVLVEGGIIGLSSFLLLILSLAYCGFATLKKSKYSPYLIAMSVMIFIHAYNEFTLSIHWFIPVAFAVYGLFVVTTSDDIKTPELIKKPVFFINLIVSCIFLLLISGNSYSKYLFTSEGLTLSDLETGATYDYYEKNDYMLSYVLSTVGDDNSTISSKRTAYLNELLDADVNAVARHLIGYYLDLHNYEKALEQALKNIERAKFDQNQWNQIFKMYYDKCFDGNNISNAFENKEILLSHIELLIELFNEYNAQTITQMELNQYADALYESILTW